MGPMTNPTAPDEKQPGLPAIDMNEYGGKKDGERQAMNRRLFMQLLVLALPGGVGAAEAGRPPDLPRARARGGDDPRPVHDDRPHLQHGPRARPRSRAAAPPHRERHE